MLLFPQRLINLILVFLLAFGIFLYAALRPQSLLFGRVIYQLDSSNSKSIALTFDDGPSLYTSQILDILDQENLKATFFLIGKNVDTHPGIAAEIARRGHTIGNHSYSHSWQLSLTSQTRLMADVSQATDSIYRVTGIRPSLFRPPLGLRTPWMLTTLWTAGYQPVTWDDMTFDYLPFVSADQIASSILAKAHPGAIIVLHDGLNLSTSANRAASVAALKIIIHDLKSQGYHFVQL